MKVIGQNFWKKIITVALTGISLSAVAQNKKEVLRQYPENVHSELQDLSGKFAQHLYENCAESKCFYKGCVVKSTRGLSKASNNLPGLPGIDNTAVKRATQSKAAQLSEATCYFAHTDKVKTKDAIKLKGFLQTVLSIKDTTKVVVVAQSVRALPESLKQEDKPKPEKKAEAPKPEPTPEPFVPKEPKLTQDQALVEFWEAVVPHFFWMIGILLATVSAFVIIWALRKIGRLSPEEQLMLATESKASDTSESANQDTEVEESESDRVFIEKQAWILKIKENPAPFQNVLKSWFDEKNYPYIAQATLTFQNQAESILNSKEGSFEDRIEFADFLKHTPLSKLPSQSDLFKKLSLGYVSVAALNREDISLVQLLRNNFESSGLAQLISSASFPTAAYLYALSPVSSLKGVNTLLSVSLKAEIVKELLKSNRISPQNLSQTLNFVKKSIGLSVPEEQLSEHTSISGFGVSIQTARALSFLMADLPSEQRIQLVKSIIAENNGVLPTGLENIVYPEMLLHLQDELRNDILLNTQPEVLLHWLKTVGGRKTLEKITSRAPNSLKAAMSVENIPESAKSLSAQENLRQNIVSQLKMAYSSRRVNATDLFFGRSGAVNNDEITI